MNKFKLTKEVVEAANSLIIKPKIKTFSYLTGEELSPFRGSGIEFKEFRRYEFGDDVRHICWPLTARLRETMIKVYEEERRINVVLLVDMSGSSECGCSNTKKNSYAELITAIGFASLKEGHKLSAVFFSDKIRNVFSALGTKEDVLRAAESVIMSDCYGEKSDIKPCFRFLNEKFKEKIMVIIISDFLLVPFEKELFEFSKKNLCILVHCVDEFDSGYYLSGIYHILDPETQNFNLLDVNSKKQRELLKKHVVNLKTKLKNISYKINTDYIFLELKNGYLKNFTNSFNSCVSGRLFANRSRRF